jgi:serine/threonine-protein kinase
LDGSNVAQLAYSSQLRCEEGALPRFQMNQVLPAELWDEPRWNSLSIYPLAAGGDSLGAMICEGPPEHHVTYTFMGVQLVAALRRFSTLSLVPGVSDGSTASAVTPPTQMVGRYRILRRLGAGGAASVYLAEADVMPGVARRMALKLLHFRPDAGDWARHAAEEARIAASIHHPNVVPVLEVGEDNSQVYLVMEYVEGDSLASIVARQRQGAERMPLRIVARILVDVLAGLHAAHELRDHAGIALHLVHRDVAPKNILVGLDGVSRLTDFGIAKTRNTTDPTALGVVKGTVRYMAPEQAMGRPLDRRADLWAIGVMAWELLACRRLYEGDVDAAVLLKLVNEPIPELGKLAPDVPEPASKWVSALLQKDPRGRLGTASAARAALFGAWETLGGVADTDEVASFMCDLLNAKKPAPSPSGAPTNAV